MTSEPNAVTIVVPAFNVERYLAECLDSLVGQTAWPFCRVIVVDDGSTDATAQIASDFSARHPTISVLHQKNSGPGAGAARNNGLDEVDTEFVLFVDGDDELTPTAIDQLRSGLLAEGLDLAVGASEQFPDGRRWLWSDYFVQGPSRALSIEDVPLLAHDARTCNKLYRTSWLRGQDLRFAEGIHHQDTVVNVPAMLLADRFFLVGDVVHRYRKRAEGGSVMDSHFTRVANYWDHLQVIEALSALRPRLRPSREPLMQAFIARSFQGFSWRAPEILPADRLQEFFDRSSVVLGSLEPSIIELATRHAGDRSAYVTMLEDDFASFRNLSALTRQLHAHDGDLHLGIPATSPEHRQLLRTGKTSALATGISADRKGQVVALSLQIRGFDRPDPGALAVDLRVVDDAGTVVSSSRVVWEGGEGSLCLGEARIPWSKAREGAFALQIRFRTPTGAAKRWLRRWSVNAAPEPVVPDATVVTALGHVGLAAGPDGRVQLTVSPSLLLAARNRVVSLRNRLLHR